jgi:hypothetical protein
MMLAMRARLFLLQGIKRISRGAILGAQILPAKAKWCGVRDMLYCA